MRRLIELKREWKLEDEAKCQSSLNKINASSAAAFAVDEAMRLPEGVERDLAVNEATKAQSGAAPSIFQKKYLVWPLVSGKRFASPFSLAAVGLELIWTEIRLFFTQRLPLHFSHRRDLPSIRPLANEPKTAVR